MKRLISITLPLMLVFTMLGTVNAQDSQWKQTQLTWSSVATQTILQGETKYSDAITLSETISGSKISIAGIVESLKFPSKLSFEIKAVENTCDSSNVAHSLQFSSDGTNFYDWVALSTHLSVATANETDVDFTVLMSESYPDVAYARVKSVFASGITDTVDISGYISERFTP